MTSEIKLIANRENGKLGGPKTEAGKAAVRLNAVTHGLLSKDVVVRGEDPEAFNQLQSNLRAELAPEGELETMLVDRIASCIWRLIRVSRVESTSCNKNFKNGMSYPYVESYVSYGWEKLSRYETTIERQMYKAMHELERMQRIRRGENTPAPLAIDVSLLPQN